MGKFKYYMLGTSLEKLFFEFGFKMSFQIMSGFFKILNRQ